MPPGVDPPWDKPQDTQHCPNCEEMGKKIAVLEHDKEGLWLCLKSLTVHHEAQTSELAEEKDVLAKRLAEAEKLATEITKAKELVCLMGPLAFSLSYLMAVAFLSHQPGEYVAVKRDLLADCRHAVEYANAYGRSYELVLKELIAILEGK
jgi:hypothetical protein